MVLYSLVSGELFRTLLVLVCLFPFVCLGKRGFLDVHVS